MKRKLVLVITTGFLSLMVNGQQLDLMKTFWSDFKGSLGDSQIVMTLWADENDKIKGNYCDLKGSFHKIELKGTSTESRIVLDVLKGNAKVGHFSGSFTEKFDDRNFLGAFYEGVFTDYASGNTFPFQLLHERSSGGTFEHRYMDLFASNEEVETFVQKIKSALLENDMYWLADNLNYPIKVSVAKDKMVTIATRSRFLELYGKIFPPTYLNAVKDYATCNLWVQSNGVAFGKGELWIHNKNGSTVENYSIAIKEIHAYF